MAWRCRWSQLQAAALLVWRSGECCPARLAPEIELWESLRYPAAMPMRGSRSTLVPAGVHAAAGGCPEVVRSVLKGLLKNRRREPTWGSWSQRSPVAERVLCTPLDVSPAMRGLCQRTIRGAGASSPQSQSGFSAAPETSILRCKGVSADPCGAGCPAADRWHFCPNAGSPLWRGGAGLGVWAWLRRSWQIRPEGLGPRIRPSLRDRHWERRIAHCAAACSNRLRLCGEAAQTPLASCLHREP
jgi:hypothetical protein